MEIKFRVNGQTQLSRNLRVLATSLPNMKDFFNDAIDIVEEKSEAIFSSKGQNVEKWPKRKDLSPSTKKARDRRWWYYKNPPLDPSTLRRTWRLQNSKKKTVDNLRGIFEYTAPYAQYHQSGGWRLPARPLIDLDNSTNDKIVKAAQKKINDDLWVFGRQV